MKTISSLFSGGNILCANMRAYSNVVFLVLLLFIETLHFCLCRNSTSGYMIRERQALQKFKASFTNQTKLISWEGNDYCRWKGVECDGIAGHVVKLDLRSSCFCELRFTDSNEPYLTANDLDHSLLELKHLNYLDLSGNYFSYSPIPTFLGSMKQLRYLNLSYARFRGKVPYHLGNLSNLQILDVSSCANEYDGWSLYVDDMGWASKLSSLKHLAMKVASLGKAHNLLQVLDTLPLLLQVELVECGLTNINMQIPVGRANSTFLSNVQTLNLAYNNLDGPIPDAFRNLTSIRDLNLCGNHLTSLPSWLIDLHSLVHLQLSGNSFNRIEGSIASILTNICSLHSLDLSYSMNMPGWSTLGLNQGNNSGCRRYDLEVLVLGQNGIKDTLPIWFGQLTNLKILDLQMNLFYGPFPLYFGNFLSLRELSLSNNQLHGSIPTNLGMLSSLVVLDLSNNHLSGRIPESLGQLGNLTTLRLSNNHLTGIVSEIQLSSLSNLVDLQLGFNNIAVKIKSNWTPPFKYLKYLVMSACNIGPHFPPWILEVMNSITYLDLSKNQISGLIPPRLRFQEGAYVDLSNNQISGSFPKDFGVQNSFLHWIILKNNLLEGSIPDSLCNMTCYVIDLSGNRLSGKFLIVGGVAKS